MGDRAIRFYVPVYVGNDDEAGPYPIFGDWERSLEDAQKVTEFHRAKLTCVFLLMLRPDHTFYFSRVYLAGESTKQTTESKAT
jgi:hypothetical protein